jgi:hypothetical protein
MIETAVRLSGETVEENLRAELARSAAGAGAVLPVLRHLLGSDNTALFGDEVLARVRGMLAHLAQQLVAGPQAETLSGLLAESPGLLAHLHALALEWQLAVRLEQHFAVDPVVPPLLQAMIASPEPQTQDLAMKLLAAQARWCQAQRRMQLALAELPGELLHEALTVMRRVMPGSEGAEARIRDAFDESASRIGLTARLVASMGKAAGVALDLHHGGAALFASALAAGSGQSRDAVLLALHEAQPTRLAIALRAAGQSSAAIGQQLLLLQPEAVLPAGFDRLPIERAAALLAERADGGR